MHQQDRAFDRAGAREGVDGAVLKVDEIGFDAASRCGRRPAFGDEANGEFFGAEHLQASVAFGPGDWQDVFFRVHVDPGGAECGDSPVDSLGHLRGAGDAAANLVGETAKIFFEWRRAHHDGENFGGGCGAGGFSSGAGGSCRRGGLAGERIGSGRELSLS